MEKKGNSKMDRTKPIINAPFVFIGGMDAGFRRNWLIMKERHTGESWFDDLATRYETRLNGVQNELSSAYEEVLDKITEHLRTASASQSRAASMVQELNEHQETFDLDIGGEVRRTSRKRHRDSDTLLATLADNPFEDGVPFIDRDPTHCRDVLYATYPYARNKAANRERVYANQSPRPIDHTPQMLWQLIYKKLQPLGWMLYDVTLAIREGNQKYLGMVYPIETGFQWYSKPIPWRPDVNNHNTIYEYFEGKSGDGPLVLRFTDRSKNLSIYQSAVNNLHVALSERGLQMKSYSDPKHPEHGTVTRHVIAIYREHVKPEALDWDGNLVFSDGDWRNEIE